jgi:hypothetical protein
VVGKSVKFCKSASWFGWGAREQRGSRNTATSSSAANVRVGGSARDWYNWWKGSHVRRDTASPNGFKEQFGVWLKSLDAAVLLHHSHSEIAQGNFATSEPVNLATPPHQFPSPSPVF